MGFHGFAREMWLLTRERLTTTSMKQITHLSDLCLISRSWIKGFVVRVFVRAHNLGDFSLDLEVRYSRMLWWRRHRRFTRRKYVTLTSQCVANRFDWGRLYREVVTNIITYTPQSSTGQDSEGPDRGTEQLRWKTKQMENNMSTACGPSTTKET